MSPARSSQSAPPAPSLVAETAAASPLPLFSPPISASNLPVVDPEAFFAYSKVFHDERRYTNTGPLVGLLESRLAEFHQAEQCVAVASGFWALVLTARALALPGRRHVVMPALTYRRMADAMAWAGLIPRFCEVDPDTLSMTARSAAPFMDDDVALLLGVHPMVNCCDVTGLEELAVTSGVPFLIDAVESPYEVVGGRRVGSFAAPEVFSLHASKLLSGMEGGYITTDDTALAERLRLMRGFGFNGHDNVELFGVNAKLNEIHAAYALACLDRIDEQIPAHRARYEAYRRELATIEGLRLVEYDDELRPSYRQIVVELMDSWPHSRAETLAALNGEGALARAYYSPALHQKPTGYPCDVRPLPGTDRLAERFMLLPSGGRVGVDDIERLVGYLARLATAPNADLLPAPHATPAAPSPRSAPFAPTAVPSRPAPASWRPRLPGAKCSASDLAVCGGVPAFERFVPVGQLYFPEWAEYQAMMQGILARGWYTNHGPLARQAEEELAAFYGVRHTISVTNATIGIMAVATALGLRGPVIVPAFTFAATAQALTWAGLDVIFCDVDPLTHHITPETLAACLSRHTGGPRPDAVVAVNLWGGAADASSLGSFCADEGLQLIFDSAHGSGTRVRGVPLGGRGRAEIFSFHATKILSATEGGGVCTNDDELAERIRNVRSSYGVRQSVPVPVTLNGRFSEAQAAVLLHSLGDIDRRIAHNRDLIDIYRCVLGGLPGIRVLEAGDGVESNYSYAVVDVDGTEFGLDRDALVRILRAENVLARRYFHPGVHLMPPYLGVDHGPLLTTEALCDRLLQLPVGALVDPAAAARISEVLAVAHRCAPALAGRG